MAFRLRIVDGKAAGQTFVFDQKSVRVGRMADNDLVLYDTGVSRYHCEILSEDGAYTFRDVGSANGTFVDDELATEAVLAGNERLRIGPLTFCFELLASDEESLPNSSAGVLFKPSNPVAQQEVEEQKTSFLKPEALLRLQRSKSRQAEQELLDADCTGDARRTATGSFAALSYGPYHPKSWPSQTRMAVLASAGVVLLGAVVLLLVLAHRSPINRQGELFAADGSMGSTRFGVGKVDIYTPERVTFQFSYGGGRAVLTYAVGGVREGELEIVLNGESVGFAPSSPTTWTLGLRQVLPRKALRSGINILTFHHRHAASGNERFGVAEVAVQEAELPVPDVHKAQHFFALGRHAFDARTVAPQNLARSLDYFAQAQSYIELLEPAPPMAQELEQAMGAAQKAQQQVYEAHIFAAEKALRFGERQEAAQLLRELLQYIPEAEDPRHQDTKGRLDRLSRGVLHGR